MLAAPCTTRPLTLPAIVVRRPEASPPSPIDTDAEPATIPAGGASFPEAPRVAPPAPMAPCTPVAAADKKRKRPAAAMVSPHSPRSGGRGGHALSERPPLSPVWGRPLNRRAPVRCDPLLSRREPWRREREALFDLPPWTDARVAAPPASPPHPSSFPEVPDLSPPLSLRPTGEASVPAFIALSPSIRDIEGGTIRRTTELLRRLVPLRLEDSEVSSSSGSDEDMEEEEDLVGLKFVSFGEGELGGSA